jgi:site-specific recombinase XerD
LTQRAFAAFRPALLRVLRHTAVSLLKDAGVPDAVVMALVGHESSAMSHRYTHVGKEALAALRSHFPKSENRTNAGCVRSE